MTYQPMAPKTYFQELQELESYRSHYESEMLKWKTAMDQTTKRIQALDEAYRRDKNAPDKRQRRYFNPDGSRIRPFPEFS